VDAASRGFGYCYTPLSRALSWAKSD